MFKIGEFSRLGQVSIDTLRHYDALGLLKPAQVDRFTGYRYYSATQLQRLNRILALKELGFSLEEVGRILQDEYTDEQLRGMLKMQLVLAERDLQSVQSRLDRIMARLESIEWEGNMSRFEVTVKSVDAATVAAIREIVPIVEQMPERYSTLFDTIARWMVAHKLPFGSAMTTYFAARPTLRSGKCATKNKATSCDRHQRSNNGGFRSSFWLREWPRHQLDFAEYALQEEYVGGDQTARPPTRSGQERVQVDQWLRGLAPSHARTHR